MATLSGGTPAPGGSPPATPPPSPPPTAPVPPTPQPPSGGDGSGDSAWSRLKARALETIATARGKPSAALAAPAAVTPAAAPAAPTGPTTTTDPDANKHLTTKTGAQYGKSEVDKRQRRGWMRGRFFAIALMCLFFISLILWARLSPLAEFVLVTIVIVLAILAIRKAVFIKLLVIAFVAILAFGVGMFIGLGRGSHYQPSQPANPVVQQGSCGHLAQACSNLIPMVNTDLQGVIQQERACNNRTTDADKLSCWQGLNPVPSAPRDSNSGVLQSGNHAQCIDEQVKGKALEPYCVKLGFH